MISEKKSSSGQDGGISRSKWDILGRLADRYDQTERARIDAVKDSLRDEPISLYDSYGSGHETISPTRAKKIGIALLDAAGLRFGRLEERRERDARRVAKSELRDELRGQEQALEAMGFDNSGRLIPEPEKDRPLSENAEHMYIQKEIENFINNRLLTISSLESEIRSENPGVSKEFIEHDGAWTPVYNLHGLDYTMLVHGTEFKSDISLGGYATGRRVVEDPSYWGRHRDDVDFDYIERKDAVSDVICTSCINSQTSYNNYVSNGLVYGFERVNSGSFLFASGGDGNTPRMSAKSGAIGQPQYDRVRRLFNEGTEGLYSEITLERYSDNGYPRLPDFILVSDRSVSSIAADEVVMRHAKYFGIPVINIETEYYKKKASERIESILESIGDDSNYENIFMKIRAISRNSDFRSFRRLNETMWIGRDARVLGGENWPFINDDGRSWKVLEALPSKRVDFIEEKMRAHIAEIREATKARKRAPLNPSGLKNFTVYNTFSGQYGVHGGKDMEGCDYIYVSFSFSNDSEHSGCRTEIYDGEHSLDSEGNTAPGANSSAYNRIAPLVKEYEEAMRENQEAISGHEQSE